MKKIFLASMIALILTGCVEQVTSTMKAGNEIGMLADMRSLHIAQVQYKMKEGRFGTLKDLRAAGLIGPALGSGKKYGYAITSLSADEGAYAICADPDPENTLNLRHFYLDQNGVTRANHMKQAGPDDPPAKQ